MTCSHCHRPSRDHCRCLHCIGFLCAACCFDDGQFPVLLGSRSGDEGLMLRLCPVSVPWRWVARFEQRAVRNHGQTLRRLMERGGLDPMELYAVAHDEDLVPFRVSAMPQMLERAVEWLRSRPWEGEQATALTTTAT